MVEVVHLEPDEQMPELPDDEPYLLVEASDDGRFFGSGWGHRPSGEVVFYMSAAESDVSLEAALAAAREWAAQRGVSRVWVQATAPT